MRTLYHQWLDPFCRKIRLALAEKQLEFQLQIEKTWERREEFFTLNPSGNVPVLVEQDGIPIVESYAIIEYLEELYPDPPLMGKNPIQRAEIRRITHWFDVKFYKEVGYLLLNEKIIKRFLKDNAPNSQFIRAGQYNVHTHLEYVAYLVDRRNWLAGDHFSLADITAAAHLSCLDYLGDVPWEKHPAAKDWYTRIKSRPAFRPILADHVPGLPPVDHYANLDF